jgi:hypothetical protein
MWHIKPVLAITILTNDSDQLARGLAGYAGISISPNSSQ